MIDYIKKIFLAHSGVSSKRIFGGLGWLVTMGVLIYCTYYCIQAPLMIEPFMFCCMALLGIDSVADIWKGKRR